MKYFRGPHPRLAVLPLCFVLLSCAQVTVAEGVADKTILFVANDKDPVLLLLDTHPPAQASIKKPASVSDTASDKALVNIDATAIGQPQAGDVPPLREVDVPPAQNKTDLSIDLTTQPDDLWVRIRRGFSMPNLQSGVVDKQQQAYLRRHESLQRMVERSRPYLFFIVEEIEKRGMPLEIALLPMVESAFNPMARSSARAVGLWQFIPATGKNYNLSQGWWQDERRDIVESTRAALDYLQYIYNMHGDWHLALASYNCGENAVARAIAKNRAAGLPTDFNHLSLPRETSNYVPKLQALKNILSNPELAPQLELESIPNEAYFATVQNEEALDQVLAARLAGVSMSEFLLLNPAHNRPVIKANSTIVIPVEQLAFFQNNLAKYKGALSLWRTYHSKKGERLDKIAARHGISLANLKKVNGLSGKRSNGQALLLPTANSNANDVAASIRALPAIVTYSSKAKRKYSKHGKVKSAKRNNKAGKSKAVAKNRVKVTKVKASNGRKAVKVVHP